MSVLHEVSGCKNRDRVADVVFIHGLGGHAFDTWRAGKDDATVWPYWLGEDFPKVGVWSLGYAASPTHNTRFLGVFSKRWRDKGQTMALPERGLQVLDRMAQQGLGERPLFLICHSLGGLVAKHILRRASSSGNPKHGLVATNTRAVLFLATPHSGAELASLGNAFRAAFGATVSLEDLRAHDAHLGELYDWYRQYAVSHNVETAAYYENRRIMGALPIIVTPTSARPGTGGDAIPLDEDHISIAKPRTKTDQVYLAATSLLQNHVLASRPVTPSSTSAPLVEQAHRRIPHELPPMSEQFFGRELELAQLTERLRNGMSTAVVGPAGLGKTALAARAVCAVVGTTNCSMLATSPFPDGVVFLNLYGFYGRAEPAWNALANKLAGADFKEQLPARERAAEACVARNALIIVEGGEEADGKDGRTNITELFSVFSQQNRYLLLTHLSSQELPQRSVVLTDALSWDDAARLFDSLTHGAVQPDIRDRILKLLDGHPLALSWAGNLIARDDDDPGLLVHDWETHGLPPLSDPTKAEHTLEWLFRRSVRGLDDAAQQALSAAGLLAHAPFSIKATIAALGDSDANGKTVARAAHQALAQRGLLRRVGDSDQWQFLHVLGYRFARKETESDPILRVRLGEWLDKQLTAALSDDTSHSSLPLLLEHTFAILRTDNDQQLWGSLGRALLYSTGDRLRDLGRIGLVKLSLAAVADWLKRIPADMAQDPYWIRQRSMLLLSEGDVKRDQGDLTGALKAYGEMLDIAQRMSSADPSDVYWKRDLCVGYNRMGGALTPQGNFAAALAAYQKDLEITQELAEKDPANTELQLDLSISHCRIGNVLAKQIDLTGALSSYKESLAIVQPLAELDPLNVFWQQCLAGTHVNIGHVLKAQGKLPEARQAYEESLAIVQRLVVIQPLNMSLQQSLARAYGNIGDVLKLRGDVDEAIPVYEKSLEIAQRLATIDLLNTDVQRDLSFDLTAIAQCYEQKGDRVAALRYAEQSLAIDERLAATDPTNAVWQRDLSISRAQVARLQNPKS